MAEETKDSKADAAEPTEEEKLEALPDMEVATQRFLCGTPDEVGADKAAAKAKLLEAVRRDNMATYYESACEQLGWEPDASLLESMRAANAAELEAIAARQADAQENLGDIEVHQAIFARCALYTRDGDAEKAFAEYESLAKDHGKKMSTGQKIQMHLNCLRLALFVGDAGQAKVYLDQAKKLVEEGGDWDRRNRLRVYEGHYHLVTRNLQAAAKCFLDSVPTFTATEVCTFEDLVVYATTCAVLTLGRKDFHAKVVECPEVVATGRDVAHLSEFVESLYECRYADFFRALVGLQGRWRRDRYLAPHVPYLIREMRVFAYSQFLASYRSVTLDAAARAFGVSVEYVDAELSRFIAAGRLSAKIDKVGGIVETNQPDARNAQYQEVIKHGDALLNRVQKLARVVDV